MFTGGYHAHDHRQLCWPFESVFIKARIIGKDSENRFEGERHEASPITLRTPV